MQNELVSVVITTYGRTNTLFRAIKSVLNQTYRNLEVIIVDDNSNRQIRNEVEAIVSSFNDHRILLLCNSRNLGGGLSRNVGVMASSGKFIAFLDDDDEYLPQKIEEQLQLFLTSADTRLALVYCYCQEIKINGKVVNYRYNFIGNCIYYAMLDCIAATSQWMCRKTALIDVGIFPNVPCKQDSIVLLRLLINGYRINRVPEYLSIYHSDMTVRISNGGHNNRISGEEALRKLCRSQYKLLTSNQIDEVEYSFACRLLEHYYAVGSKARFNIELKKIMMHPFRRKTLASIKHVIYNN